MAVSKEEILDAIGAMSILEVVDLVKMMEDKFGVSAAATAVAVAGTPSTADCSTTYLPTTWSFGSTLKAPN